MAVAAYASLLSLTHVLDNVQHSVPRHQLYPHTKRTQSLQEKVKILLGYLELHSQRISQEMEDVARQIVVVVDEAEHIIDFHVVNQLREGSQDKRRYMAACSSFGQDISNIIKEIDSITRKLMIVKEERVDVQEQPVVPVEPLLLPSDIWEMSQLRHLTAESCTLRDPLINRFEGKDSTVLENLSTLSSRGFRCSEEAIKRVPNLKKLKSSYGSYRAEDSCYCLSNLARLNKLESLSLEYYCLLEDIAFPASLKKLSLLECEIPWAKMTIIGSSLPNLEVLKLNNAGHGYEWDPIEGEFLRLKVLFISHCDLVRWGAEDIHFPILQSLSLRYMHKLEEIPLSIGDIDTLRSIHLERCSQAVKNSAEEILKDQEEKGNETLQVYEDGKRLVVGTVS
ncbi:UNVERIFIED_CONTAM: hypothetical protein Scaly_1807200 [Sesamum calycinum]|uniref:Rx N-terminal domain-containing protein n=1 Tax=Sesamum calycinum TaxID=2727403 RepID=A0AAW2NDC4_9LAMI